MSIELVIQAPSGRIPVTADPQTSLKQVVAFLPDSKNAHALRYLQTSVHHSQWESMTLANLGLKEGERAKLILEMQASSSTASGSSTNDDVVMTDASSSDDTSALQQALSHILKSNFDQESQICLVTLMKILDNVIQKPGNEKVRSIRLTNPAVAEKVVSKGGVDYLLACGFCRQTTAPALLSKSEQGEECLVLLEQQESTPLIIQARRLLMQTAIQELHMNANDLPKYKPPPAQVSVSTTSTTANSFNPYRGHRYNATGQPQQPDSYESTTETKLRQLQSRQERLEAQLQGPALEDRELVALRPNQQAQVSSGSTTVSAAAPSDGALLAQRMQRLEQERKEREEGGFTTKAMRDLKKIKAAKVYSHAKLRIQFPDGSALECKFLPRETVETVKQVVTDCFSCAVGLQFDLYVAPPRRKLDASQTLQQEGLVPAAKCFVSWKGNSAPASGAEFLKPELFQSEAAAPSFPTAKPVVQEAKQKSNTTTKRSDSGGADASKKPSREDDLLRRMMGGSGGKGGSKAKKAGDSKSGGSGKPKWFKG